MLRHAMWIPVSVFILMVAAPDRAPFGSGMAFARGGEGEGGGAGGGRGGAAAAGGANAGSGRTSNDGNSLSAFVDSPIFARVAPDVPSTIAAGPIFAPRAGLVCQRMTQTIDIDGRAVHASALLCRQPDGSWRIAPQDARSVPSNRRSPASRGSAIARTE
jgi:hypothetical protein